MKHAAMSIKDHMNRGVGKGLAGAINLKGYFSADLFDEFGKLKDHREGENTVTTLALAMVADRFDDTPAIVLPGWMELGTGSAQGAGDSTLDTYIVDSRTANTTATTTTDHVVYVCTFGAGVGTGEVTEAGLFNVVTQNTTDLILYDDFSVVNKAAGDSLAVTWTLTFS